MKGEARVDIPHILTQLEGGDTEVSVPRKVAYLNKLSSILRAEERAVLNFMRLESVHSFRRLLHHDKKEVRAGVLRCLRHTLTSDASASHYVAHNYHILIIRLLELNPNSHEVERQQAIMCLRRFVQHLPIVPLDIVSILVSISDADDPLTEVCLETLSELVLKDFPTLAKCGGVKVILRAVLHCQSSGKNESIVLALLCALNFPSNRIYMFSEDIFYLLAPFTDFDCCLKPESEFTDPNQERQTYLGASRMAIVTLMRSWTGLTYLCSSPHGLRALVSILKLRSDDTMVGNSVLALMFSVLQLSLPVWSADFMTAMANDPSSSPLPHSPGAYRLLPTPDRPSLMNNYHAAVMVALIEVQLPEALVDVITFCHDKFMCVRATVLLGELLFLSTKVLPVAKSSQLHAIPRLMHVLSSPSYNDEQRGRALLAIRNLNSFHFLRNIPTTTLPIEKEEANIVSLAQVIDPDVLADEQFIATFVKDSNVLDTPRHQDWECDLILDFFRGRQFSKKLFEFTPLTKLIRRLLTFFKPSSDQFSKVECDSEVPYTLLGTTLVDILCASDEGLRLLQSHDLLEDMSKMLDNVDHQSSPYLNAEAVVSTLSKNYFAFLARMCSHPGGETLLGEAKILSKLYELCRRNTRDDIVEYFFRHLDLSVPGHSRILATTILASAHVTLRSTCVEHLKLFVRSHQVGQNAWCIRMLITMIYDPEHELALRALAALEEASEEPQNLEIIVAEQPALFHLGPHGVSLLTRFLALPQGAEFLRVCGFIDEELHYWRVVKHIQYVNIIESRLSSALTSHGDAINRHCHPLCKLTSRERPAFASDPHKHVMFPVNFYRELCRLPEGAEELAASGQISGMLDLLNELHTSRNSSERLHEKKAAIWSLANIASSPPGLALLPPSMFHIVTELALSSPIISIRSTCFYALSLFGATPRGASLLSSLGWDRVAQSPEETIISVVLPRNGGLFALGDLEDSCATVKNVTIPSSFDFTFETASKGLSYAKYINNLTAHFIGDDEMENNSLPRDATPKMTSAVPPEELVLNCISNMANDVLLSKSKSALTRLKTAFPELFGLALFKKVYMMVAHSSFSLASRRFINELFSNSKMFESLSNSETLIAPRAMVLSMPSHMMEEVPSITFNRMRSLSQTSSPPSLSTDHDPEFSKPRSLPGSYSDSQLPVHSLNSLQSATLPAVLAHGTPVLDKNPSVDLMSLAKPKTPRNSSPSNLAVVQDYPIAVTPPYREDPSDFEDDDDDDGDDGDEDRHASNVADKLSSNDKSLRSNASSDLPSMQRAQELFVSLSSKPPQLAPVFNDIEIVGSPDSETEDWAEAVRLANLEMQSSAPPNPTEAGPSDASKKSGHLESYC